MGNGNKFKLSNVLPNVFSKFKGIGKNRKGKGSTSSPTPSEFEGSDIDPNDFSMLSRDLHGDFRSPSPMRIFPQNRDRDTRLSSTPAGSSPRKTFDIRFPSESPVRSRGAISRSHSPVPRKVSPQSDPSCCSYDSTIPLVPHDARVRRVAPQAFGKCLIISKCNSFNGSTHSDTEISESDNSRAHNRRSHCRALSVQLEESSWDRERDGSAGTTADENGSDTSSARQKKRERREQVMKLAAQGQLYAASQVRNVPCVEDKTTPTAKYVTDHTGESECHRSACPDYSREETDVDQNGAHRHLSRKLSFTTDDNCRPFEDTSFSSDEDFYKVNGGNQCRALSTIKHIEDTDAGYTSSEMVLTEDERSHAAMLRREAVLAKAVRNASDRLARVQSRFSEEEKQRKGRISFDDRIGDSDGLVAEDERSRAAALYRREATLVKTVLSAKDWARENRKALVQANELDRQTLARIRAGHLDHLLVREEVDDKTPEFEVFRMHSHSRRSSRNPSPIGEVEKHTKGRVDYKSCLPEDNHFEDSDSIVYRDKEFEQPLPDDVSYIAVNKIEPEISTPWDAKCTSFRSDSTLSGRGKPRETVTSERAALMEFSYFESATPRTVRQLEQEKLGARKKSSRSPSPGPEAAIGMKNSKFSGQSPSPRLSHQKQSRSPSPIQEFTSGKKVSSRSPSPIQEFTSGKKVSSRSPSPLRELQPRKSSFSSSPPRDQSPASVQKLNARAEAGMQKLDSVAVVKASYDPYHDFRESMVEMILENDIETAEDLEELLQCYLSLNSSEYHKIIVQVFSDIWGDIFDQ